MKRIYLSLCLVGLAACASVNTGNTKLKEGAITYTMTIEGLPPEQAAMLQGMEMKTYFKNGKSRSEMTSAFMNSITVTDGKGGSITLMDQMGQKFYMKSTEADTKKKDDKKNEPKITYSDEKKTVAGYDCKKAVIEGTDEKGNATTMNVWYTDKIAPVQTGGKGANFKGLKGVPMEFETAQGAMTVKFAATNVSTSSVPDSKFEVSTEGYTEMKPEDLQGAQGQ